MPLFRKFCAVVILLLAVSPLSMPCSAAGIPIRIDRVTVLPSEPPLANVFVTVTHPDGQPIHDLSEADFSLVEDGLPYPGPMEVLPFAATDRVLAYTVLVDNRENLATSLTLVRQSLADLVSEIGFRHHGAVVTYIDRPRLVAGPSRRVDLLENALRRLAPTAGRPVLYDGLLHGLRLVTRMEAGDRPPDRRVLVLLTEGLDRGSMFSRDAVASQVLDSGVGFYVIAYGGEKTDDVVSLGKTAAKTGGRLFTAENPDELKLMTGRLADALKNQYVLTFRPETIRLDGNRHRIEVGVKVRNQEGSARADIHLPLIKTPPPLLRSAPALGAAALVLTLYLLFRLRRRKSAGTQAEPPEDFNTPA